ncbi:unnamed protein product [Periconia digitata]|uniref:Uncharacterized protein n=1 Tax=Periconia digitata TaxID=1303443 RepID=A0A9W4UQ40_9PLEO|nr:unnamed protein product [Periconia digitata]
MKRKAVSEAGDADSNEYLDKKPKKRKTSKRKTKKLSIPEAFPDDDIAKSDAPPQSGPPSPPIHQSTTGAQMPGTFPFDEQVNGTDIIDDAPLEEVATDVQQDQARFYISLRFLSPLSSSDNIANTCGHDLHPLAGHDHERCPPCLVDFVMREFDISAKRLKHGDWHLRAITDENAHNIVKKVIRGEGKKGNRLYVQGWRAHYVIFLEIITQWENQLSKEMEWAEEHPEVISSNPPWANHTCAKGLERWASVRDNSQFQHAQTFSERNAYERAKNLAAYIHNPTHSSLDDNSSSAIYPPIRPISRSPSRSPSSEPHDTTPCTKRALRSGIHETGVGFANHLFIRSESDVDTLRILPSFTKSNPHKHDPSFKPRSILRTTPHPGTPSDPEHWHPVRGAYEVVEDTGDFTFPAKRKYTSFNAAAKMFYNLRLYGERKARVNTSLCSSGWSGDDAWEAAEEYVRWMSQEAEEWDEQAQKKQAARV